MLNDEICNVRNELNKSIEQGRAYDTIYNISVKLDKLIEEFYSINVKK